jgi:hypothetical protein
VQPGTAQQFFAAEGGAFYLTSARKEGSNGIRQSRDANPS